MIKLPLLEKSLGRSLLSRFPRKPYGNLPYWPKVIYVEPIYRCNLRCVMCPRDFDTTPQGVMPVEVFERSLPALRRIESIVFAGWGESLMAPHVVEWLEAVSTRDFQAAMSTNGLLLKGDLADRLVRTRPFWMNVSIDAGCRETYAKVRGRDRFDDAVENLGQFMDKRNGSGSKTTVEWVFVIMKSNFRELPKAVELACEAGVDKFTAKHLELASTVDFMDEALWEYPHSATICQELAREMEEIVEECERIASGRIRLNFHPLVHSDEYWKKTGPVFKMFLTHEGNVTACSFISPNNHRPFSRPETQDEWTLGNVLDTPLEDIIQSEAYANFQRTWFEGQVPVACEGCPFSERLGEDGMCHAL